ncbi:MAG: ribosome-associated translation inhibitor RaiA [Aquificae bacterium]|nr:ribosome-associated translation inhibitor RaiA [Aquificota bacterium]
MNVEYRGVDVEISDAMKALIESKLNRFKRYLKEVGEDEVEAVVAISSTRARQRDFAGDSLPTFYRVDLHLYLKNLPHGALHAWEEDTDVFTAIDKALDELEKQLVKLKERRHEQIREARKFKEKLHELELGLEEVPKVEEEELVVDKPMSLEDAVAELEETHAYFLPFVDVQDGELKILYRKRGGKLGLLSTGCKYL